MLHRMEDRARGVQGYSPEKLRQFLDFLVKRGTKFVSLEEVFQRFQGQSNRPLDNAAAFTMDDGFAEQVEIALPIFQEFECPVTVFITTGFVDGALWPWADHVAYIFESSDADRLSVKVGGKTMDYDIRDSQAAKVARRDFRDRCKILPHEDLLVAIQELSEGCGCHDSRITAGALRSYKLEFSAKECDKWDKLRPSYFVALYRFENVGFGCPHGSGGVVAKNAR